MNTPVPATPFNASLNSFCEKLANNSSNIVSERKQQLNSIAEYIKTALANYNEANLVFICTHNSRRSHFGQVLMYAATQYFGIEGINTFSGGTEATAANIRTMKSLERAGFTLDKKIEISEENPTYYLGLSATIPPQQCFSKVYDDAVNPDTNFAAIMVCSSADQACPFIPGATSRISLPFIDPKRADDTTDESQVYDDTSIEIGTEMFYVASLLVK